MPRVLAIETSCDETSVAILCGSAEAPILEAHCTLSHARKTQAYGGIVPEIVAREHLQYLEPLIAHTLAQSLHTLDDIDLIAATCGPGLMGGLVIGATTAKTIALARNLPFVPVNHLEGHALSPRLSALTETPLQHPPQQPAHPPAQPPAQQPAFPYLLLLVSGGHCQLLLVLKPARYQTLGQTRDDSAGECLDKGARLLGLSEASGAALEAAAQKGNANRFAAEITTLPQPMRHTDNCDFSFSGLKSALARALVARNLTAQQQQDGAAALQKAVFAHLTERSDKALQNLMAQKTNIKTNIKENIKAFAVAGGVAANRTLYAQLQGVAEKYSLPFFCPRGELCTDNAAMIAYAALARLESPLPDSSLPSPLDSPLDSPLHSPLDSLAFPVRPRWYLSASTDSTKAYVRPSLSVRTACKKSPHKTTSSPATLASATLAPAEVLKS